MVSQSRKQTFFLFFFLIIFGKVNFQSNQPYLSHHGATQALLLLGGKQQEGCSRRQGEEWVELPLLAATHAYLGSKRWGTAPLPVTSASHSLLLKFSPSWDTTKSNLKIRCPSPFGMWLRPIVAEVGEPWQCCRRQISPGSLITGWRAHWLIAYWLWSFIKSKLNFPSIDSSLMEGPWYVAGTELLKANTQIEPYVKNDTSGVFPSFLLCSLSLLRRNNF